MKTTALVLTVALLTAATPLAPLFAQTPENAAAPAAENAAPKEKKTRLPRGERGERGERGNRGGLPTAMLDRLAETLKLDEAQKTQLGALLKEQREATRGPRQTLRTEQTALHQLMNATPVDEITIRSQAAKIAAIEADLAVAQAHQLAKAKAILNPQQLELIKASPAFSLLFTGQQNVRANPGGPGRGMGREGRGPRREHGARPAEAPASADKPEAANAPE